MNIELLTAALIAGVIATIGMTAFIQSFYQMGVLRTNAVQAIGSFISQSPTQAVPVGWLVHFITGIAFAVLYTFIISESELGRAGILPATIFSGMLGFSHGLIVGLLVIISVGEHHPVRSFRADGMGMAALYVAAHIIYGALIGLVVSMSGAANSPLAY